MNALGKAMTAFGSGLLLAGWLARRSGGRELNRQTVLITGGSRGLGLILARDFARQGCRVAICARDLDELESALDWLHDAGCDEVMAVRCDVGERLQVEQMILDVVERFGRIDLLVNNAGTIQIAPIEALTRADFEEAMNVIYWGTVNPTLTVLPLMRQAERGHIVNITSIGGKVAIPHLLPYNSAKFAAVGFSEGLAAELAGTSIRVTTIVPGLMRNGAYANAFFKGDHRSGFIWFALLNNLPWFSIDAEQAAQKIVRAVKRGETELVLTQPARLITGLHGLFPDTIVRLFGLSNVWLKRSGEHQRVRGMTLEPLIESRLFHLLIGLGKRAARRFNQFSHAEGRALEQREAKASPSENGHRSPLTL